MLRFDVETIYKATNAMIINTSARLRFDVETIYKATKYRIKTLTLRCGLM